MTGKLWALQFKTPESARLCAQKISFEELPEYWRCFECKDENGRPWKSGRIECEPREEKPRELFFYTAQTGYLLEINSAA